MSALADGTWSARFRTPDLQLTDPVEFTQTTLVENYGVPDMLQLEGRLVDLRPGLVPSQGVVVSDDQGRQRFSGVIDPAGIERRGDGTGTVMYASDTVLMWWRHCYPVPANQWTTTGQTAAYDVQTGPAETKLLSYINRNLGPGARSERRQLRLRLPASEDRGPVSKSSVRFDKLGELVSILAESAALRVRIVQTYDPDDSAWLDVVVEEVPDLTAWARFGTPEASGPGLLGDGWGYRLGRPLATVILSAAGGEGAARILGSVQDAAAETLWNCRVEQFQDQRGTTDAGEITRGMQDALESAVGANEVTAPLGDTELNLGVDIPVGAKAAAVLDGLLITERIRQLTTVVQVQSDTPTVSVTAVLGQPDATFQSPTQKKLAQALRRISNLERNV